MKQEALQRFFEKARDYMVENYPEELEDFRTISAETFRRMRAREFLTEYVWVVYVSGFGEKVLRRKFPGLRKAFAGFDLHKMSEMTSVAPVLAIFNNERKANYVLKGARLIREQGFASFKKHIAQQGPDALEQLPGIGPINKDQLARNIGLASVAKNDMHIQRLVTLFSWDTHYEMTQYLARKFRETPGVVDVILFRFCQNNGWKTLGYPSLEAFTEALDC